MALHILRYSTLSVSLGLASMLPAQASPPSQDPPQVPVAYSIEEFQEAIRSGGPGKDGIPSIDRPRFVSASQATLSEGDKVIGVYHRGQARAYPQRILVWHEIVNDEVGGDSLSITYCPLTGTALGFKRGETEFGVSGKLVNSNLIMYDRATDSEWPQILGVAIDGPMVDQGLEEFRVFWTTWGAWQERHPETEVLTEDTGYVRNYRRDPYGSYDPPSGYYAPDSRRLFPVMQRDDRFPPKTVVFGVRSPEGALAITQQALRDEGVVDLTLGERRYTVIHDPGLDTGWAFYNPEHVDIQPAELDFTAEGVSGPGIASLEAVNGFEAMWFAWAAFYPDTYLHEKQEQP
ncbi:DUF3179 domain-containing protein [Halomonas sp. ML-15]|uniref:DUF3179 domain-containing protein n=1 Tax=Halomonas sp. ML-15 TaxID=2773305 RepID=UPI0017476103|nr:DUF3179 domain-containing protein [Halomonas sp. ML-15]MBD3895687.1 DUF3179 domain-containing protein [Halomonas sp. ML-15]